MPKFLVLIGCDNDATGKRYEPGAVVTEDDFPEAVILDWVEIGVLQAVKESSATPDASPMAGTETEATDGGKE